MPAIVASAKLPAQAATLYVYDTPGSQWQRLTATGGALDANIKKWGGTDVSGRDITPDIQSLGDPAVQGVLRSLGVALVGYTDATANETIRRFVERTADSVDTIGPAAGLLRTLGDPGAIAIPPLTGKTVAKILEDILTALGGVLSPQWDSYSVRNTGAAPFAVTVDSTVDGGRIVVSCHASMPLVAGNNATIAVETSNDNVNWVPEFTWTITDGGAISQQFFNARRYIRQNATAVVGGVLTMDLASSR
jgi:hypothetical protein